ncbi:MAG: hypothetical protein NT007_01210 [Candidatus Kapabacteria bacterium]|nr:hypothetical protein [Candidatus Kapabacteria bacterium]
MFIRQKPPLDLLNEGYDITNDYVLHINFRRDESSELLENRPEDIFVQINPNNFHKDYSEHPQFIRKFG